MSDNPISPAIRALRQRALDRPGLRDQWVDFSLSREEMPLNGAPSDRCPGRFPFDGAVEFEDGVNPDFLNSLRE